MPFSAHQLVVGADSRHHSSGDDDDLVRITDRVRRWAIVITVRALHQPLQGLDHQLLRFAVERRGRLVQQ